MARKSLLAPLLLTLLAVTATAQDVRQYRTGDTVDPHDVAAILKPMKMRSIRLLDDAPGASAQSQLVAAAGQIAPVDATAGDGPARKAPASALSLPVQFSFDSADILPSARLQLDALAEGILMLPSQQAVVIEGHTDATGPESYNEQLSQRRAYAVKRYLVATHHIEPARLRAVGMGEFAPLNGRDAYAAENRRVQFRGE